jgi:hypothetical protein
MKSFCQYESWKERMARLNRHFTDVKMHDNVESLNMLFYSYYLNYSILNGLSTGWYSLEF